VTEHTQVDNDLCKGRERTRFTRDNPRDNKGRISRSQDGESNNDLTHLIYYCDPRIPVLGSLSVQSELSVDKRHEAVRYEITQHMIQGNILRQCETTAHNTIIAIVRRMVSLVFDHISAHVTTQQVALLDLSLFVHEVFCCLT
jgi:hypothetical protein